MIAPLRRRHFFMWLIIAPVILLGTSAAYLIAPKFLYDNYKEGGVNFPELLRSIVSNNYMFNLKKNYSGGTVLEVIQISNVNPVTELVTIQYSKPGSKKVLKQQLGMMSDEKMYSYTLGRIQPPFEVAVADTIKKTELARVQF